MVSKEEFNSYLQKILSVGDGEKIKIAEKNRKKITPFLVSFIILTFVPFIVAFALTFVLGSIGTIFVIVVVVCFAGVFICMILYIKVKNTLKQFENKYKGQLINFLLKDKKFVYDAHNFIDIRNFKRSGIYSGYISSYRGEDYLSLNIPNDDDTDSNFNLILSDLRVKREYKDNEGKNHTQIVYNGIFGYIDFPFEFVHPFFINKKVYTPNKLEKIKLEDIKFNKCFSVYCDDQVEARYILTTSMMQKLMLLRSKMGNLFIIMKDKTMFLGFSRKTLFKLNTKNGLAEAFFGIYEDLEILLELVKEIQTNNKIFKI